MLEIHSHSHAWLTNGSDTHTSRVGRVTSDLVLGASATGRGEGGMGGNHIAMIDYAAALGPET